MTMCGDWLEYDYSTLVRPCSNNVKISTAVAIVKLFEVGIVFFYARSLKSIDFRILVREIWLFENEPAYPPYPNRMISGVFNDQKGYTPPIRIEWNPSRF